MKKRVTMGQLRADLDRAKQKIEMLEEKLLEATGNPFGQIKTLLGHVQILNVEIRRERRALSDQVEALSRIFLRVSELLEHDRLPSE